VFRRQLAALGLCVALTGSQPGCARQLSNQEFAVIAVYVGLVAGAAVLATRKPATSRGPEPSPSLTPWERSTPQ
jgi:hypothetical protein